MFGSSLVPKIAHNCLSAMALVGLLLATTPAWASFIVVDTYDATTNTNVVDQSATTDATTYEISLDTFKTKVADAYVNGMGGVFDFDNGSQASGVTSMVVDYGNTGSGTTKSLTINNDIPDGDPGTKGAPYYSLPFDGSGREPISGQSMLGRTTSDIDFIFNLTDISSSDLDEKVVAFGITVLSRTQPDYPAGTTASVTAYFSGGGSVFASDTITYQEATDDTFFGFEAPDGQYLTYVRINLAGPGDATTALDDLGFVTAAVPEPGTLSLLTLGLLALVPVARRSRKAANRVK